MTLRQIKRAVRGGSWVLAPGERVTARTEFQRGRLTAAVTAARLYLDGSIKLEEMGNALGVTGERAAQIVRLGVNYMLRSGWLRQADGPQRSGSIPS